jgi:hypothetical protein
MRGRLPGQLRLELPRSLYRGHKLLGGDDGSLDGDAGLLLDPIRSGNFHACKPFQGLFHFSLAAPSGHAGNVEHEFPGLGHGYFLL